MSADDAAARDAPPSSGFRERVQAETAEVRAAVDALPFLRRLGDGDLPPHVFRHYLEQDSCYLRDYARALALLAARAPDPAAAAVWAGSAAGAVAAEQELHADLLAGLEGLPGDQHRDHQHRDDQHGDDRHGDDQQDGARRAGEPVTGSPTTVGYASWLVATAATAPYAVAAAAVLPCFTVYADVGAALAERARAAPGHPYARWVQAYADPGFQASSRAAAAAVEAAVLADPGSTGAAVAAAVRATRFEWMFWDAADRVEGWPV